MWTIWKQIKEYMRGLEQVINVQKKNALGNVIEVPRWGSGAVLSGQGIGNTFLMR